MDIPSILQGVAVMVVEVIQLDERMTLSQQDVLRHLRKTF